MPIDDRVAAAIRRACEEEGQPHQVATRLIKWASEIADGNAELGQRQDSAARIEDILNAAKTSTSSNPSTSQDRT